jgi:CRISPR/Cas system-associated exonuclease Cas4 (RecB family)
MRLRGSIDLVETIPSDDKTSVRVTDHKTGSPPRLASRQRLEVGGGEVLQPIIYGLAAEQLLDEEVEYGQLSYCTRRGAYQRRIVSIHSGTCAKLKQVLETIDRSLEEGFLPAAPRPDACKFCDFQSVCGPYEETRIRRKEESRLADLNELRRLP